MRINVWNGPLPTLKEWAQDNHAISIIAEGKAWPTDQMVLVFDQFLPDLIKKHGIDGYLPEHIRKSVVLGINPAELVFNDVAKEGLTLFAIGRWDLLPSALCPQQLSDWYSKLVIEDVRIFEQRLMKGGCERKCSLADFPLAQEHVATCSPCARKVRDAIDRINGELKHMDANSSGRRKIVLTMELQQADTHHWSTSFAGFS